MRRVVFEGSDITDRNRYLKLIQTYLTRDFKAPKGSLITESGSQSL